MSSKSERHPETLLPELYYSRIRFQQTRESKSCCCCYKNDLEGTVEQTVFQRWNYREQTQIALHCSGFAVAKRMLTIYLGTVFKKKNRVPDCYWGLGPLPESLSSNHCGKRLPQAAAACETKCVAVRANLETHGTALMFNAWCICVQQSSLKNGLNEYFLETHFYVNLCLKPIANAHNPACFLVPLTFIIWGFHFDFRKICQVELMTSLMFCLTHMDIRTRIQICFLYPYHTAVWCLQWIELGFFGAVFCQRDRIFFLALMKTSTKTTAVTSLVKQVFVNKVTKGIL